MSVKLRYWNVGFLFVMVPVVFFSCRTSPDRPDIAIEYHNIAHAYFELGRYDDSARYYARAIELDPSLARTSYNLARIRVEQRWYSEADEILSRILAGDPENVLVLKTRGYGRFASGRFDDAVADLKLAAELSPFDADIPYNLGLIERNVGRHESAFSEFSRARELAPSDPDAVFYAATTAASLDDSSAFGEAAEAFMALSVRHDNRLKEIGAGFEKFGMFDRALVAYVAVLERAANDAEARFRAARVLLIAIEDEERGFGYLTRAIADGFADVAEAEALANEVPERLLDRVHAVISPLIERAVPETETPASDSPPDSPSSSSE